MSEWIKCDERLPKPYHEVMVEVFGSDLIMPRPGESLEEATERIGKMHYTTTAFYSPEEGEGWCNDGFPMVVAPRYWREFPVFDAEVDDE